MFDSRRATLSSGPRGNTRTDIGLALILIGLSGNMALIAGERRWLALVVMAGLCFALLAFRRGSKMLTTRFLAVGGIFGAIGTVHLLYLDGAEPLPVIGFLVRVFCAYAVVRLTHGFTRSYTQAMVLVAGLGLSIFLVDQLLLVFGMDLRLGLEPLQRLVGVEEDFNVLVHNFQVDASMHRNAGMFWEPGAFAGYLVLALLFLHLDRLTFRRRTRILYTVLLFAALATTQSTTGYIAGLMVAGLHATAIGQEHRYARAKTRRPALVAFSLLAVAATAFVVASFGFITPKIRDLYERADTRAPGWELSRFGSAVLDWEYVSERPISGWGAGLKTRYQLHPDLTSFGMGNGLTDFAARYGTLGLLTFLLAAFVALRRRADTRSAVVVVLIVVVTLNGEWFLGYPVFLTLMFL